MLAGKLNDQIILSVIHCAIVFVVYKNISFYSSLGLPIWSTLETCFIRVLEYIFIYERESELNIRSWFDCGAFVTLCYRYFPGTIKWPPHLEMHDSETHSLNISFYSSLGLPIWSTLEACFIRVLEYIFINERESELNIRSWFDCGAFVTLCYRYFPGTIKWPPHLEMHDSETHSLKCLWNEN